MLTPNMKNVAQIAYSNFCFDHICRKKYYVGLKIDFRNIKILHNNYMST